VPSPKANPPPQQLDQYAVHYIVLARYMRLFPPSTCWKFAGGRIINLHHGLLPAFPGLSLTTMPSATGC
jgi:formyltetrahydrofolate hydrolase